MVTTSVPAFCNTYFMKVAFIYNDVSFVKKKMMPGSGFPGTG